MWRKALGVFGLIMMYIAIVGLLFNIWAEFPYDIATALYILGTFMAGSFLFGWSKLSGD